MTEEEIKYTKENVKIEIENINQRVRDEGLGEIANGASGLIGAGLGTGGSIAALAAAGSVVGLSAAGVTSGLAAIGALVGGGMVAGVALLALPVVALGGLFYGISKHNQNKRKNETLLSAVKKLANIRDNYILQLKTKYSSDNIEDIFKEEIKTIEYLMAFYNGKMS